MLFIVATPIGNLEDITLRALNVLNQVDFVVSEDTRETLKLLSHYNIKKPLISYYRGCEKRRSYEIIKLLQEGKKIALVCDRGTPGISDPAHYIVEMCHQHKLNVIPVPGASALTAALSVSGFPVDCFSFYGFIPRKKKEKIEFFNSIREKKEMIVFFESVHRIMDTLEVLKDLFPERRIVVCRELTKKFEEIVAGSVSEIYDKFRQSPVKGEFVLILGGKQC
ncbi:MAG: 16S rRNA (cytidine(1402)-2'-O)-methyltransferase [Candidatus Omnitrophica bacterium]|jgi:16S rRNA (cytidine1402-2'-O)-methyltransferase|nr:16S rRNA (cytidine(1402)-2'-O)-methyltransferase [Candidatus Omnitrophota bacterium]